MDSEELLAALPHRPPFLFVDRVLERAPARLVAEWDVRADLPAFQGHFPGRPVLPGVLIAEFCFQAAAILCSNGAPAGLPVLTKIADARFKHVVGPGATLRAEVELTESLANARYCKAHVTSAGVQVLRIEFVVALVPLAAGVGA